MLQKNCQIELNSNKSKDTKEVNEIIHSSSLLPVVFNLLHFTENIQLYPKYETRSEKSEIYFSAYHHA
jgi:hypothetical protein